MTEEEAREGVAAAIRTFMQVTGLLDPCEELLNHWCVLTQVESVQRGKFCKYAGFFHEPNLMPHVAKGLVLESLEAMDRHDHGEDHA